MARPVSGVEWDPWTWVILLHFVLNLGFHVERPNIEVGRGAQPLIVPLHFDDCYLCWEKDKDLFVQLVLVELCQLAQHKGSTPGDIFLIIFSFFNKSLCTTLTQPLPIPLLPLLLPYPYPDSR